MQLANQNDPILTTSCLRFNFTTPPFDPIEFAQELVKFMYECHGIGLAANQVGVPYRIFAMRGAPENFVCYNPKIVTPSEQTIVLEEGCLTYPGLFVKVKRPQHIRVRFQTPNGAIRTETFTGMTARIFQHEIDHLDGIIFYSRANRYHRDQAIKRWNKEVHKV
ncbi:MAG: peptide deformylase [Candidatus Bathyarchaeia archaeon]